MLNRAKEKTRAAILQICRRMDAVWDVLRRPELGDFVTEFSNTLPWIAKQPTGRDEVRLLILHHCIARTGGRITMSENDSEIVDAQSTWTLAQALLRKIESCPQHGAKQQ